jgi:hypothetical protein
VALVVVCIPLGRERKVGHGDISIFIEMPNQNQERGKERKRKNRRGEEKEKRGWVLLPNQLMREREGRETKLEREEERGVSSDSDRQQWHFRQTRNSNSVSLHA